MSTVYRRADQYGELAYSEEDIIMVEPHRPQAIKIDGYLTEAKLPAALQQIVSGGWLGDQVCVEGSRYRWDMSYQIDGQVTVVEYDGDEHYRHSLKIKADRAKDDIGRKQGYSVGPLPVLGTT